MIFFIDATAQVRRKRKEFLEGYVGEYDLSFFLPFFLASVLMVSNQMEVPFLVFANCYYILSVLMCYCQLFNHLIVLVLKCRWVEFSDKRVAKRVANMLNGEQIGKKNLQIQIL